MKNLFPDFKATFLIAGTLFTLLSISIFMKGLIPSMAEFNVPEQTLQSPHYYDAMLWVYVHMTVIGLLLIILAFTVREQIHQKRVSLLLVCATGFYTYLDFRSADWMFGHALYKGPTSVIPAIISLAITMLFLQLAIRLYLPDTMVKRNTGLQS